MLSYLPSQICHQQIPRAPGTAKIYAQNLRRAAISLARPVAVAAEAPPGSQADGTSDMGGKSDEADPRRGPLSPVANRNFDQPVDDQPVYDAADNEAKIRFPIDC